MIQRQIKLRLKAEQEKELNDWLFSLTGVYNWGIRKIELDAKDGVYHTRHDFRNLLVGHGKKIGIPSHTIQGILDTVYTSWQRCFKKICGKPKLKGNRRKLNSIPFPDPICAPSGNCITLPVIGTLRFHK
jgi:hypothetical protein